MIKEKMKFTYEEGYSEVKREVDRILSTSPFLIKEYMDYLALTTGKFVRASGLLISAMDEEDEIDSDAIKLAAAIELIHLASLVHDDIIDNAETRRGQASLQKKYGKKTAVICGDYLLATALKTAASAKGLAKEIDKYIEMDIPDYMSRVCLGELSQHVHNNNFNLSTFRYLKIIAGKTGALFEASFHGGASLASDDLKIVKKYAKLGRYIGMIFQLTDDCMDFEATEQTAKKPVKSDYDQKVVTLPLIYALRKIKGLKADAISGKLSREAIDQAVKKAGGIDYTRNIAMKYYKKSIKIIESMTLTEAKRERLFDIVNRAYRVF